MTQCATRGLNQFGAVVERNDMHARRQAGFNLPDFLLHAVDYVFRVLTRPCHDHATDGFRAVFYKRRRPEGVADLDSAEVFHKDRSAVMRGDDDIADIVEVSDQAKSAHDGPGTVFRNPVAAAVQIAGHDRANHGAERERIAAQAIRIEIDLVLLDRAPDACQFSDAGTRLQLRANVPILQGTKIPQAESTPFDGVPENFPNTGPIRFHRGNNA